MIWIDYKLVVKVLLIYLEKFIYIFVSLLHTDVGYCPTQWRLEKLSTQQDSKYKQRRYFEKGSIFEHCTQCNKNTIMLKYVDTLHASIWIQSFSIPEWRNKSNTYTKFKLFAL